MKHVILFGFKGCGKSFWGERLARELALPFIDTDHLIEQQCGASCSTYYHNRGETAFRALEHQVVASLEEKDRSVIALGGGTILFEENLKILEKIGRLIYLKASEETLKNRILHGPFPAYLDPHAPETSFEAYYKERFMQYMHIPTTRIVDTDQEGVMEQLKRVLNGE